MQNRLHFVFSLQGHHNNAHGNHVNNWCWWHWWFATVNAGNCWQIHDRWTPSSIG